MYDVFGSCYKHTSQWSQFIWRFCLVVTVLLTQQSYLTLSPVKVKIKTGHLSSTLY